VLNNILNTHNVSILAIYHWLFGRLNQLHGVIFTNVICTMLRVFDHIRLDKIIPIRAIYGNLENKINKLYCPVENSKYTHIYIYILSLSHYFLWVCANKVFVFVYSEPGQVHLAYVVSIIDYNICLFRTASRSNYLWNTHNVSILAIYHWLFGRLNQLHGVIFTNVICTMLHLFDDLWLDKIIPIRAIYGNLENKINKLYCPVENSIRKNNNRRQRHYECLIYCSTLFIFLCSVV
jgi:hypothetical protein